jgi:hypothetical protein
MSDEGLNLYPGKAGERLEEKRKYIEGHMDEFNDMLNKYRKEKPEFVQFLMTVIDGYMLHECALGRSHTFESESD